MRGEREGGGDDKKDRHDSTHRLDGAVLVPRHGKRSGGESVCFLERCHAICCMCMCTCAWHAIHAMDPSFHKAHA